MLRCPKLEKEHLRTQNKLVYQIFEVRLDRLLIN
jgi:hypothetical protein